jgi:hypothetical protein
LTPETEVNTHPPMSFIAQYNIPRLNEPNGTSFTSMFQPHAVIWPTSINFIEGLFLASSAISCSTRSTVFNRFLRQRSNALTRSLVDAVWREMVKWWQGCQENNSFPKTPYTTSAPTRLRTGFTPSSLFNPPHHMHTPSPSSKIPKKKKKKRTLSSMRWFQNCTNFRNRTCSFKLWENKKNWDHVTTLYGYTPMIGSHEKRRFWKRDISVVKGLYHRTMLEVFQTKNCSLLEIVLNWLQDHKSRFSLEHNISPYGEDHRTTK